MAAPAVVAVGAVASGTATVTPAFPAGAAAGNILVTALECTGNQVYTLPTGWLHVLGSPNNVDTSTRLTVIWRRMQVGDVAPAVDLPGGDHAIGRMIAISGTSTTDPPWDGAPITGQETVLDTSANWPATVTTVDECLMLYIIATGRDINSTANLGAMTGGTLLTFPTERMDNWILTGAGGGIGMVSAVKATAGTIAATGATMASTDAKALMVIAIAPSGGAPPPTATLWPRRMRNHPSYRR